ncbi:UNVERIFIED_CONTAM: hypothetical protein FKN15_017808 [Acipenser sinensis]
MARFKLSVPSHRLTHLSDPDSLREFFSGFGGPSLTSCKGSTRPVKESFYILLSTPTIESNIYVFRSSGMLPSTKLHPRQKEGSAVGISFYPNLSGALSGPSKPLSLAPHLTNSSFVSSALSLQPSGLPVNWATCLPLPTSTFTPSFIPHSHLFSHSPSAHRVVISPICSGHLNVFTGSSAEYAGIGTHLSSLGFSSP